jgi:hypothetical protein
MGRALRLVVLKVCSGCKEQNGEEEIREDRHRKATLVPWR